MFISRVENASLCPYKSNITVPMAIAPGSMDVMLSLLLLDGHINIAFQEVTKNGGSSDLVMLSLLLLDGRS